MRRSSEQTRVSIFSNDLMTSDSWGRQGLDYIALRVQHELLDQTDLSNGLDTSSKAVGDRHMKLVDRWDQGGRVAPPAGRAAPPVRGWPFASVM